MIPLGQYHNYRVKCLIDLNIRDCGSVAAEAVPTSSVQGGNVASQAGGSSSVQDGIPDDIPTQSSQANDNGLSYKHVLNSGQLCV